MNPRAVLCLSFVTAFVGAIMRGPAGLTLVFVGVVGFLAVNVSWLVTTRRRGHLSRF